MAASPRYIYASTATRRRRPYPLIAGLAIIAALLLGFAAAAF